MTEYIRSLTKNIIVLPNLPEKTLPAAGRRPRPRRNMSAGRYIGQHYR